MDLLLLAPIAILGFLLWWEKRDRATERIAWQKERSQLLTRIQAPELVPSLEPAEPSPKPLYVSPELDEEWSDYQEAKAAGEAS